MTNLCDAGIKISDQLTIVAIILGPILALSLQRGLDHARAHKSRQLHVFRTLMSTRATAVAPAHVEALNLILIEFNMPQNIFSKLFGIINGSIKKYEKVLSDWRTYLDHLNNGPGDPNGPAFDHQLAAVWRSKTPDYLSQLLQSMGSALGFKFTNVEVKRGSYWPQALVDVQSEDSINRKSLNELWLGKRSIPVSILQFPGADADQRQVDTNNSTN